jgi:transcriptional regulator with XRE-family HTH domain
VSSIGQRLRLLIREKGLEQKKFAEIFGLKVSTLNGYVTGYRTPDITLQKRFADFFGVSVDYLIGRTDNRNLGEKTFKGSNIVLIKGNMSYAELSCDIARKLCFPKEYGDLFSPKYLEEMVREFSVPTPQRLSLLSAYAEVSPEFFYNINSQEDLILERIMFRNSQHLNVAAHLSDDLYDFVTDPRNEYYVRLAADLKKRGIDPEGFKPEEILAPLVNASRR